MHKFKLILYITLFCCFQAFGQTQTQTQTQPQPQSSTYLQQNADIISAAEAIQNNHYEKAIGLYQKHLKNHPDDKDTMITLFRLYLMQSNYLAAQKLLTAYFERFGQDDAHLIEKVRYYVLVNKTAQAFQTLLNVEKYRLIQMLSSAAHAIQSKNYKKGIILYQEYLDKNPQDKHATLILIRLQLMQGHYDDAEELLATYFDQFGEDKFYLIEKGRFLALTKKADDALAILGPLLKNDPSNKVLLYIKQYALSHKINKSQEQAFTLASIIQAIQDKNLEEGIALYQQYLNKSPNDKALIIALILLQLMHGHHERAVQLLTMYSYRFSKDYASLLARSHYLAKQNKKQKLLAVLEPLVQKDLVNQVEMDARTPSVIPNKPFQKLTKKETKSVAVKSTAQSTSDNPYLSEKARDLLVNNSEEALKILQPSLQKNLFSSVLQDINQYASTLKLAQQIVQNKAIEIKTPEILPFDNPYLSEKVRYLLTSNADESLVILPSVLRKSLLDALLHDMRRYAFAYQAQQIQKLKNAITINNPYLTEKILYLLMNNVDENLVILPVTLRKKLADILAHDMQRYEAIYLAQQIEKLKNAIRINNPYLTEKALYLLTNNVDESLVILPVTLRENLANILARDMQRYEAIYLAQQIEKLKNAITINNPYITEKALYLLANNADESLVILPLTLRKNLSDILAQDMKRYAAVYQAQQIERLKNTITINDPYLTEKVLHLLTNNVDENPVTLPSIIQKNLSDNMKQDMQRYAIAYQAQQMTKNTIAINNPYLSEKVRILFANNNTQDELASLPSDLRKNIVTTILVNEQEDTSTGKSDQAVQQTFSESVPMDEAAPFSTKNDSKLQEITKKSDKINVISKKKIAKLIRVKHHSKRIIHRRIFRCKVFHARCCCCPPKCSCCKP